MSVDAATGIAAALSRIRDIQALVAPAPAAGFAQALDARAAAPPAASAPSAAMPGGTAPVGAAASATGFPVTAAELDAWMARKNPGAPLVGMGNVFVREGLANGVDPRALVAIARAESSLGADPGARARNNAFGWGPHRTFGSWEENIATVARGLRSGYLDDGLTTLAQIQRRYAPVGTANDPANLNSNWLRNTTILYRELGGDPEGSVALAPAPG